MLADVGECIKGDCKMKRIAMCVLVLCLCLMSAVSYAAKKTGSVQAEDFSYKGLVLGDDAAVITDKLGEADFDTDIVVLGETVKAYVYGADLKVCVDPRSNKVVAILCKDKAYKARDGVTYGSTKAKLMQVYGKGDKLKRDGDIYYVYRNPDDEKQKLMLSMETTSYYVESFLLTSLPLTEEEQAEYDMGEFPTELGGQQDDTGKISGGFNSRGEWWAQYRVNDNVTIGI